MWENHVNLFQSLVSKHTKCVLRKSPSKYIINKMHFYKQDHNCPASTLKKLKKTYSSLRFLLNNNKAKPTSKGQLIYLNHPVWHVPGSYLLTTYLTIMNIIHIMVRLWHLLLRNWIALITNTLLKCASATLFKAYYYIDAFVTLKDV